MPGSKTIKILSLSCAAIALSGCVAPLIVGGTGAAAFMGAREKGIKGTFSDTKISTKVKMRLYGFSPDLHAKVAVNVQHGEVLLTGVVPDETMKEEAERLAKETEGVTGVINNIETQGEETLGSLSKDGWITTKIKSKLMIAKDLYSINYSVKTVNGVVYLTGTAYTRQELDKLLDLVSRVSGVKKVVDYVKIKGEDSSTTDEGASDKGAIATSELPPAPSSAD